MVVIVMVEPFVWGSVVFMLAVCVDLWGCSSINEYPACDQHFFRAGPVETHECTCMHTSFSLQLTGDCFRFYALVCLVCCTVFREVSRHTESVNQILFLKGYELSSYFVLMKMVLFLLTDS